MFTADWEFIIMRKQLNVEKDNIRENNLHVNHDIKVGESLNNRQDDSQEA